MNLYLCLSERYRAALETFDPMKNEWFLRIADPWPGGKPDGKPTWFRILLISLILIGPLWIFSAISSTSFGSKLCGVGGLASDIGLYAIIFYFASTIVLIVIMRRVLGDLQNELVIRGIAESSFSNVNPAKTIYKGRIMVVLEWLSRVDGYRGMFWYLVFVICNSLGYYVILADGIYRWGTSPVEPGTFFYFLRVANEQPNLAGIWSSVVFFPIVDYLVLLMVRLLIVFACQCIEIAGNQKTCIIPAHPDGTGGLLPVGQVALLFTLATVILGIDIAGMTINEFIVTTMFPSETPQARTNLQILYIFWACYLIIGSLLFYLPLLPLRTRMASAKRDYLLKLNNLFTSIEQQYQTDLSKNICNKDTIQILDSLYKLVQKGSEMAVWPFDKKTFIRYASLFVSPLIPFIGKQFSHLFAWAKVWLGFAK